MCIHPSRCQADPLVSLAIDMSVKPRPQVTPGVQLCPQPPQRREHWQHPTHSVVHTRAWAMTRPTEPSWASTARSSNLPSSATKRQPSGPSSSICTRTNIACTRRWSLQLNQEVASAVTASGKHQMGSRPSRGHTTSHGRLDDEHQQIANCNPVKVLTTSDNARENEECTRNRCHGCRRVAGARRGRCRTLVIMAALPAGRLTLTVLRTTRPRYTRCCIGRQPNDQVLLSKHA